MTDSQMPPVSLNPAPPPPIVAPATVTGVPSGSYLKKLFSGRMNRRTYFWGPFLFGLLLYVALIAVYASIMGALGESGSMVVYLLNLALSVFSSIIGWSCSVRRAHDIGKKWTYLLWLLIPFVNIIISLILLFRKGDQTENAYGPVTRPGVHLKEMLGLV